jgi:CubicO group peptidase (beta-lactamase class C family)
MTMSFKSVLAGLCLAFVAATASAAPSTVPPPPALGARIDAVFADHAGPDSPGYAVAVVRDGELWFARGYGQANLDDGVAITPATAFHLASVSKQFTAAAVALLILDGRLSLEDPLSRYVPEAARFGPELKIKHLIYMTSGLPEYTGRPRPGGDPWFSAFYFTRDDAIAATLAADKLDFAPGAKWAYSNVNYMLLTRVVEVVSGQRFADFARERLFAPLGMSATLIDDDTTAIIPHRAIGYGPRSPEIVAEAAKVGFGLRPGPGYARLNRNAPHFGGSGVFSTLEDLARWDANWDQPRLGPGFAPLILSRMTFAHPKDNDAFGLVHGEIQGRPTLWYAGSDLDASTYMVRFPGQRTTVVCLSNLLSGDCEGRARKVVDILIEAGVLGR